MKPPVSEGGGSSRVSHSADAATPTATGASKYAALPATVPEVLRAAADLIEPKGRWQQEDWFDDDVQPKCFCAEGALYYVMHGSVLPEMVEFTPAGEALKAYLNAQGLPPNIVLFNDAPDRTQAEVVAALRRAADLAEADGALGASRTDQSNTPGLNESKPKASAK